MEVEESVSPKPAAVTARVAVSWFDITYFLGFEIDGVKFLARKSSGVNFWTNSMSA